MPEALDRLRQVFAERYQIQRELGRGGMSTVYLARDLKHERLVALKVLRPELTSALGGDRFPREIRIIARLTHPHILPLHDSGELGGFLYYVMPYVEGRSLRQRLDAEGPLAHPDAVRILREVADALAYAHGRGIIHRDIKPDNVMLSGRHALVTDFGVAKAVSDAGGEKLTTVGVALGTPSYMSPEQAMGQADIDHRSDIYALGALAYEILTGSPPFDHGTPQAILSAHVMESPVDVRERNPDVPPELAAFIMRCLRKDPDDRWQSADEIVPRLEALATPSGGLTPTHTRPVRARPATGATDRHRARRAVTFLVVGALAVGAVGTALFAGDDGIETIAVLPFLDMSGTDQVFVDALHDALITRVGRADIVKVVSRSGVMRYRGTSMTTEEIADELGVQAVVEGTTFRDGGRMRVNIQMVDPRTLRQLWGNVYERDVDDVLAVQGDVADSIAVDLQDALRGAETAPGPAGEVPGP